MTILLPKLDFLYLFNYIYILLNKKCLAMLVRQIFKRNQE
jgi:hypothetical protein